MTVQLSPTLVDPHFVQVQKRQAAEILGVSLTEFNRMRVNDPKCPKGHTRGDGRNARVFFRLSDIYAYSEALMASAPED